jgi:hypothetical protein
MDENELKPTADPPVDVERLAAELGLQILRASLANYPGCTHWHFTKPGVKGTLECTWWPRNRRLWLSVHSNRAAAWQASVIEAFRATFG